jgi:hypothetical protein
MPPRRYFTTNDPVMTPALLDHFFNRRTQGFAAMDARQRRLLHAIYDRPDYAAVLPPLATTAADGLGLRRHPRHAIRFPALFTVPGPAGVRRAMTLREISLGGCQVELATQSLSVGQEGELMVQLGAGTGSVVRARVVRSAGAQAWGLSVRCARPAWMVRPSMGLLRRVGLGHHGDAEAQLGGFLAAAPGRAARGALHRPGPLRQRR